MVKKGITLIALVFISANIWAKTVEVANETGHEEFDVQVVASQGPQIDKFHLNIGESNTVNYNGNLVRVEILYDRNDAQGIQKTLTKAGINRENKNIWTVKQCADMGGNIAVHCVRADYPSANFDPFLICKLPEKGQKEIKGKGKAETATSTAAAASE